MKKDDVISYLWNIGDRKEIDTMWNILKRRAKQLDEQIANSFSIGDKVSFKGRYNRVETGVVTKVNTKTINVRTESNMWRVAPSILNKVTF